MLSNFLPLEGCRREKVGYIVPPTCDRQVPRSLTTWLVTPRSSWESAFVFAVLVAISEREAGWDGKKVAGWKYERKQCHSLTLSIKRQMANTPRTTDSAMGWMVNR